MGTYSKVIRQMRQISHSSHMVGVCFQESTKRCSSFEYKYLDPCRLPEVLYRYRVAELVFSNKSKKNIIFFVKSLVFRDLFIS